VDIPSPHEQPCGAAFYPLGLPQGLKYAPRRIRSRQRGCEDGITESD
jgi:hypothetical protein